MEEVDFLFDNQLIAALESLIRSAKHKLILISPYIDLDARIVDALNEKNQLHNFELFVLFGKNDHDYYKSIKKGSLEIFKQFPNVEIRYNDRLHAKFYQNEFEYIMTSLNLYDYSLANNIEVGIKGEYSSRGILGKVFDVSDSLIMQGVDKLKEGVLGIEKEHCPIDKFKIIFESSVLMYKTEPKTVEKKGLQGLIGYKKLNGFNVVVDKFNTISNEAINDPNTIPSTRTQTIASSNLQAKSSSASQLSKAFGIQARDITFLMQQKGLINGEKITEKGITKGLVLKSYMGNEYIAYPENLPEFNELRK